MSKPRRDITHWLLAWWDRRGRDVNYGGPNGPDRRLLDLALARPHESLGGRTVLQELEARGYDITTLRFEIQRKAEALPPSEQPLHPVPAPE